VQATDIQPLPSQPADDLAAWLRLVHTPGAGPAACRRLLDSFKTPDAVFGASRPALQACVGVVLTESLLAPTADVIRQRIDLALDWASRPGHAILCLHDPAYPLALAQIADPPAVLYVAGKIGLLAGPAMALVGSRNASTQGKINAEVFAEALAWAGLTIVSGLALGIDAAAHNGALGAPGSTVAVVGTGPDLVYPARNRELWECIIDEGCVVSEYAPGTPPIAHNFPQRNRIISGLSLGVLVVEAAAKSGSLITARLAASQGRDVFAIPGSIHSALAKGCHLLIKEGAKLVESAADVLEEVRMSPIARMGPAAPPAPEEGASCAVLAAMGHEPIGAEALGQALGQLPHAVSAMLLELELAGRVERLPDGRFQQIKQG
jgi:DNA processing protein